jgi:hypothetical protein
MRKISSKEKHEKKQKKNQLILGVILIVIMLFSTFAYSFMGNGSDENSEKVKYNDYEFIKQNNLWYLEINENVFVFSYNPKEVEKIPSYVNTLEHYYNLPLYIYSENPETRLEISRNMANYVLRVQNACVKGEECYDENLPIKTCEENVILVKESEISLIKQEENCVFIQGKKEDLLKITDEFLFKILGID